MEFAKIISAYIKKKKEIFSMHMTIEEFQFIDHNTAMRIRKY